MLKGSWRTTALGILTGASLLIGQAVAVLDNDPATEFDFEKVSAALGLIGIGVMARDAKVSSEQQGIK